MHTLFQEIRVHGDHCAVDITIVAASAAAEDQVIGLGLCSGVVVNELDIRIPDAFLVHGGLWFGLNHFDLGLFDATFYLLLFDGSEVV